MGKNNIKLKISGSVHCVSTFITCKSPKVFPERNIFFFTKFKMAAKRHVEVVIHKLFSQGECSLDPLKKLVVEIIAFSCTLGSLETDSG